MSATKNLNKTIKEVWEQRYVVPLYQRNFAWGENQIGQLLQDIYDHSPLADDNESSGRYYLGSLILLQRSDGVWEVIDGQQRLTALHLICRYLGMLKSPRLTFDSRPEVENFFNRLYNVDVKDLVAESKKDDSTKVMSLVEALDIVNDYKIRRNEKETFSLSELSNEELVVFREYLSKNVILVCTPLPQDTDVAAYFEIMNNRGEQLQSHEILKALLMRELKSKEERRLFAQIWDACSQMNRPIQQSLKSLRKAGVFGENYDSLDLEKIRPVDRQEIEETLTIDQILASDSLFTKKGNDDTTEVEDIRFQSIIDFPNFLMHVLRLYEKINERILTIPLNSDKIPVKKPQFIDDSLVFIKHLLKVRTLFDRYVVKMQGDEDEESELKWRILRPYRYDNNNQHYLRFALTENSKDDEQEESEAIDDQLIKLQSMLQVSFRNRKYKTWLYDLLELLLTKPNATDRGKLLSF